MAGERNAEGRPRAAAPFETYEYGCATGFHRAGLTVFSAITQAAPVPDFLRTRPP